MTAGFDGLKVEIARIARKATGSDIGALAKKVAEQRRSIVALRREISELRRLVKAQGELHRSTGDEAVEQETDAEPGAGLRFRAAGLASQRRKLGLSAAQMGKLIGASGLSVYKWEKGQAKPRSAMLVKIAQIRGLGKREVQARLSQMT